MSRPRAAMSVATRTRSSPDLNFRRLSCRAVWDLLPWMAAAVTPLRVRSLATLSAPCLVRVKTRALLTFSCCRISSSRSVLFFRSTRQTSWRITSTGVEMGAAATFTGSWSSVSTRSKISGGRVAEKNMVCFFSGRSLMTLRTSWIKPISSIRSASSRTKISTCDRSRSPCPAKSNRRPGVAVRISTPRLSFSTWGAWPTPPKMTASVRGRCLP